MSSIRNKISTKELIDAILKITNSVILYDRKPLEKDISAVLFITSDSYEKTLECQLLQKNYSVLFSNLPFDQIQQKIVQLFCIFENGTFKKQFKQYSKKTI